MGFGDLFGSSDKKKIRGDVTFQTIEPGDVVMLWDGTAYVVDSILDCSEMLRDRSVAWRWILLDGGGLLEVTPAGMTLYDKAEVFLQGSTNFYKLVADPEAGGTLKSFEGRVRDGSVASSPVTFAFQRRQYRVKSTGTFVSGYKGKHLEAAVWADISPNAGDNVYFKMESRSGEEEVLGIWTSHIAFLRGRRLTDSDIRGLYGKG